MTDQPACRCGCTDDLAIKRIIIPCAGVANVGQITNKAAIQLVEEGYGGAACVALLATGSEGLKANLATTDEIIILDGCPVRCARTIADRQGIACHQHIIVTECGIPKGGSKEYTDDDVETIASAAWEGAGRKA